ncbi:MULTISPECIES: glycine cleavage system aminomethyltransferase GcvT [unclassified Halanaerobium]|uniref:glycine cleavage system aminomethyltransferase GcvT n=1 Tax=unclassified Halanaerobium TaxID=2641197 RepID=UPI000DF273A2|nr:MULTISPECIES: glycine cleavage system aminomethyltransferase GcvT [unclassified Halanaerobium]RCW40524.1 aminomethyltransferase [Halanaerobium sp. MA284_MarDTE_T2]RCW78298.1 aminomethyltransferase [Halanaerobium sp. DL-01]
MKKTPLNETHKKLGAKMIDFGGWEMPVEYSSIIEEHKAVREKCGIFDVSHMGEIIVSGKKAEDSIQRLITNDAAKLSRGEILYTPMCNEEGGIIDDLLVYKLEDNKFMLVVNASNTEKDYKWISSHLLEETAAENKSEDYALIALQGPESRNILQKLTNINLAELKYYKFEISEAAEVDAIISRTGYTGELGYELYFSALKAEKVWDSLMEAGENYGLKPAGLGARNTLRLEKKMNLYGNDMTEKNHPLEAGLGWTVKLDKGDFIGREKIKKYKENGYPNKLAGFKITGRGIARHGYEVYDKGKKIGVVTSGSYSPTLEENIGLAYLDKTIIEDGREIEIKVRNRFVKAEIVEGAFV